MSTVIHRSFSVLPESVVADRVRVVLADRPDVVREGIARLLGEQDDLSLVAVADDLIEASRAARAHRPDVIVTDLLRLLSDGDGAEDGLEALVREAPTSRVVILTDVRDPLVARDVLGAGARGFALKSARAHELFDAVRRASDGETYLAPALGGAVADLTLGRDGRMLTPRESEILRLVALGFTNAEIAEALYLSIRTIETHRARLHTKLGTSTRAELVRAARERGLLA
jgi:two-component system response regulator NreC